jgi:hypothetical protein
VSLFPPYALHALPISSPFLSPQKCWVSSTDHKELRYVVKFFLYALKFLASCSVVESVTWSIILSWRGLHLLSWLYVYLHFCILAYHIFLFLSVCQSIHCQAVGKLNNDLERKWKEANVTYLETLYLTVPGDRGKPRWTSEYSVT